MNIKAVIFDMDGLLVDSELFWETEEKRIWKNFGIEFTEKMRREILGHKLTDIAKIAKKYKENISEQEVIKAFMDSAERVYLEKVSLLAGVDRLLKDLKEKGIKLAISSSSPDEWIQMFIERFGYEEIFDEVCSAESLQVSGKPDPAVYNVCMEKLGTTSEEVIVFEDSLTGVQSAKASGAYTIAVPDSRWCFGDYSIADLVLGSLSEFDLSNIYE